MKLQNLIHIVIGIVCVGFLPNARPLAAQSSRMDDAPLTPNSNVQEAWVARYNAENDIDEPSAIAVDGSGNVYVTGRSYTIESWTDYATIKYSSAGVPLWTNRYERDLRDVLVLRNEIVSAIVREIKAQLSPGEQARLAPGMPGKTDSPPRCFVRVRHRASFQ
jgi:hypothetical protein